MAEQSYQSIDVSTVDETTTTTSSRGSALRYAAAGVACVVGLAGLAYISHPASDIEPLFTVQNTRMVQRLHDVNTQPLSLEFQEESSLSSTMGYIAGGVLAALAVTGYALSRSSSGKSSTALNVVPAKGIMQKEVPKKEEWVPVLKAEDIAAGDLVPVEVDGLAILIAADLDGKVFAIANSCPHLGTPLENGRLGENSTIVCPLHKSAFSLKTGAVVGDWCPYPPVLGPLVLGKLAPAQDVSTFPVRSKGKNIEVLIDRNLKERFESGYWEGILDAKGKANGEYY